ncbi:heparinase II/III domain-containing protein [Haloterrigena salifodinae]|uniref:heparinase II/III domain-containing protein n=1 Tax=Haloterrigena salifodinae TaxID=2675099 RepID=UPI000F863F65|nr:heparinase II/III family protein [Haloterrigena salifodinae]
MPTAHDQDYPPGDWTVGGLRDALEGPGEAFTLPTYDDEAAWTALRTDELTREPVEALLDDAESARDGDIPSLTASQYLDYERTGDRTRYEAAARERRGRLSALVIAACVERDDDFDPILDYAWALCEQATWTWPAHLGDESREGLPGAVPNEERTVALFTVGAALLLAEVDAILGDRLHPALRERIRSEVDRRVFTPYEKRDDLWWTTATNNWNAVCSAGVALAALHLIDDADRQARIVERVADGLGYYLDGFGVDGGTTEGVGYWNYGVGNYVALADALESATDGSYSLCSPPKLERLAAYPLAIELSPGHFVPFSDSDEESAVAPRAAAWLGRRLDKPGLAARGRWEMARRTDAFAGPNVASLPEIVRDLHWTRTVPASWTRATPPTRRYFGGCEWWITRSNPADPDGLVVAAKAGHNGEPHNHNDCGSFVVHENGESLLTDPGRPEYDRDYFGPARYEYVAAHSLGHSVPYVNGVEQAAGDEFAATVLDRRSSSTVDAFEMELADCYPEDAGLESLRRTVTLDRTDGVVSVDDDAVFANGDNTFESTLISTFPIRIDERRLVVDGERGRLRVTPDDPDAKRSVERLADALETVDGTRDVWRARIAQTVSSPVTSLRLRIEFDGRA